MNLFPRRMQKLSHSSSDGRHVTVMTLMIFVSGCGERVPMGGPRVEVVPVTGTMLVDGEPAEGVVVYFRRVSDLEVDLPVPSPRGYTDKDGVISLSSYVSNDGGIPGEYKLYFEKPARTNPLTGESTGDVFRGKYSFRNDSEFAVTIPEEVGDEPFDLGTLELTTR